MTTCAFLDWLLPCLLHWNERFGHCSTFYDTSPADYRSNSMVTCCVYWKQTTKQTSSLKLHCFCSISRYGSFLKLLNQDSLAELALLMKHIKLFLSTQRVKATSDLRILCRNSRFQKLNFFWEVAHIFCISSECCIQWSRQIGYYQLVDFWKTWRV